ncbi:MAG TPA: T9SS type A sorting domain-containing protein [Bacteroidia bacterium]|nr:T9SS type A sorting domain-containing protein [Bacteroidia bacterium]
MKNITKALLIALLLSGSMVSRSQIINTIAGNGVGNFSGDGGPATAAELFYSGFIAFDTAGNLYVADYANVRVRMINTSGIINTVAGGGSSLGNGGPATAAQFNALAGIGTDVEGNLYICDEFDYVVRKVNTSGIINAFAGNYAYGYGYSGDGGPATNAELNLPAGVALDAIGNVYIADMGNCLIRVVDTTGNIHTFAGNYTYGRGFSGDGGPATAAEFNAPDGITLDRGGNMYISDANNHVVRKVNALGIISTFAGDYAKGAGYSGDGGYATMAELNAPVGLKMDASGNLYIADQGENVVRVVSNRGKISTCAGNFALGAGYSGDGGPATAAELNSPVGLDIDRSGKLYIGDMINNRVRVLDPITTGTNELPVVNGQLMVYPNPTTGVFTISFSHPELDAGSQTIVEVYNIMGQKVMVATRQLADDNLINMSNQPNGIYFYRIIANGGNILGEGKLVIEK